MNTESIMQIGQLRSAIETLISAVDCSYISMEEEPGFLEGMLESMEKHTGSNFGRELLELTRKHCRLADDEPIADIQITSTPYTYKVAGPRPHDLFSIDGKTYKLVEEM